MKKSTLKMRRWRKKNRERQRENDRRWRKNNPEKVRAKQKRWYKENRESELARNAKYHRDHREEVAARHRLGRRRMTQEQHDALLKKQKHRCGICRRKFTKTPHIDHHHKTNKNRGLLCDRCNPGLGLFLDNIRILKNAIQYLKEYNDQ